jgi:predicted glycosyltransferase
VKTVALLVKNGIGFGHLRRAVLIAEAIRNEGRLRPVIISQASSLSLFRDTPVEVVNFPLLHRVSSAVAEDSYTAILDRLLERLDPAVVIEDTYPDPRYLSLKSLAHRPRLLVMRRLDGASFDHLRTQGRFAAYDKILIAQSREDFSQEGHSGDSVAAVHFSTGFSFIGNLSYSPTPAEISQMRAAYAPNDEPLVVVNGGAGGDQMPDGYGDRLFSACAQVAAHLQADGHRARFVFVTGPYYAGKPLLETENVTVRQYEPGLAALLAAAQVAIIKPGNNALSEALLGQAHLVLVPDVSFLEGLDEHAARIAEQYGGATAKTDPKALGELVREALARPPRLMRPEPNHKGLAEAVDAIHRLAEPPLPHVPRRPLMLVLKPGAGQQAAALRRAVPEELKNALVLGKTSPEDTAAITPLDTPRTDLEEAHALVVGAEPPAVAPQEIADQGIRMLVAPNGVSPALERWQRLAPSIPALTVLQGSTLTATDGRAEFCLRRLAQALTAEEPSCVILDLSRLTGERAIAEYLAEIGDWLRLQPVELIGPETGTALLVRRLLESS